MTGKVQGPLLSVGVYVLASAAAAIALWSAGYTLSPSSETARNMALALALWLFGFVVFGGRFVRPRWKAVGKGIAFLTISYFLFIWIGTWAWLALGLHQGIGMVGHLMICRQNEINWITVEPRDKYIALMEKWATGKLD